jgi:hypothetical protein
MTVTHEVHLHDPQTLYRHWEDGQWNPWDIDLSADREQWAAMPDSALVSFVLGLLMVAEERITTQFSGLVGAHNSEEEATSLATQQFATRLLQSEGQLPGLSPGTPRFTTTSTVTSPTARGSCAKLSPNTPH